MNEIEYKVLPSIHSNIIEVWIIVNDYLINKIYGNALEKCQWEDGKIHLLMRGETVMVLNSFDIDISEVLKDEWKL